MAETHLRASDAERNEVVERLARHFADGRLDQAEYRARVDRAMGATTRGDLAGLFDDLPALPSDLAGPPPRRRRLVPVLAVVLIVALAASWSFPFVHVPWLLVLALGIVLWHRAGRHDNWSGAR